MNANATARGTHEPVDDRQLVSETGSVLLTGGSNAGRVRYLCRAARETHRDGRDVLFVAAGEGADRLRTALPEGIAIVECTPSGSPDGPNGRASGRRAASPARASPSRSSSKRPARSRWS